MAIWEWALEAYARPGVPEACLKLQDEHGQNVSLLLWAVHAETKDSALLSRAAEAARAWDQAALVPLRQVRRTLKAPLPPVDDDARLSFREDVKAVELAAERLLLETLEGLTRRQSGAHALDALMAASAAWGTPAPADALAQLAAALG
ncbi:TIGR02444 family protein [Phenylobacterium kunshanense]|uniref:TIGR02444 family protein n=1 Tax=Phenylobacterium kunshanense TaxID=1445034 RepID=A0A328BMP6_9CAUL|nr:TIGR02444 family protein [Phenylobacterium kunshanense]RAK67214.1 TIGR02444 family protein [Phenylobacterium kunshanense]